MNNQNNNSLKVLIALVIVLIALVIILGGSFIFMYFNDSSSGTNQNPVIENTENESEDNNENKEDKNEVEEQEPEKTISFAETIFNNNEVITKKPTLTQTFGDSNDTSGLYASTDTNSGEPTYYFRGDEVNNYVKFAGKNWRIIRINEDKTIRLILAESIGSMMFNSDYDDVKNSYYSNSDIVKPKLESWYKNNIANNSNYSSKIATGNYYCEQAKVTDDSSSNPIKNVPTFSDYTPNFKCSTDANGYGKINASIGLITYDEVGVSVCSQPLQL